MHLWQCLTGKVPHLEPVHAKKSWSVPCVSIQLTLSKENHVIGTAYKHRRPCQQQRTRGILQARDRSASC
jgi:hypothetical protein